MAVLVTETIRNLVVQSTGRITAAKEGRSPGDVANVLAEEQVLATLGVATALANIHEELRIMNRMKSAELSRRRG